MCPGPQLKPPSALVLCSFVHTHLSAVFPPTKTRVAQGLGRGLRPLIPPTLGVGLGTRGFPLLEATVGLGAVAPPLFITRLPLGASPRLSGKGGLFWLPEVRRPRRFGKEPSRVPRGSRWRTSIHKAGTEPGLCSGVLHGEGPQPKGSAGSRAKHLRYL